MADDITVISLEEEHPLITPSFPGMKIWEDSLMELGKDPGNLNPIRADLKKYLMPVKNYRTESVEAERIFMLATHNREAFEIRDVKGIEKFNLLKNNTYFFRGMNKTGILQHHFALCNTLAQAVPVTQVIRPNNGFRIPELIDSILLKAFEH